MTKEVKPYKMFQELSLQDIGSDRSTYNILLTRVKQAYVEMRIKKYHQKESKRSFIRQSVVEAKKNKIYFEAVTKFLLDWNNNHGGKGYVRKIVELPYLYFNDIIFEHYPNRFPTPMQMLPQSCIDKWELYWHDEKRRYLKVDKQVVLTKAKKLSPKEKANKKKYGFKNISALERRVMNPHQYDVTEKKAEKYTATLMQWQEDLKEGKVLDAKAQLQKDFEKQIVWENTYSRSLYHIFVTLKHKYKRSPEVTARQLHEQCGDRLTMAVIKRWMKWKFDKHKLLDWNPLKEKILRLYDKYNYALDDEGNWSLRLKDNKHGNKTKPKFKE